MKNKPYSKSQGKPAINWWKVIKKLRAIAKKHPGLKYYIDKDIELYAGMRNYNDSTNSSNEAKVKREEASFLKNALTSAYDWVMCACGNQCELIPRGKDGSPLDNMLLSLGQDFPSRLANFEFDKAEEVLQDIEDRAIELLNQRKSQLVTQLKEATRELKRFK